MLSTQLGDNYWDFDNYCDFNDFSMPASAPPLLQEDVIPETVLGGKKVVNVADYVDGIYFNQSGITHRSWEASLWFANLFIIPLIVYPILSLVGHLVIEIRRDSYLDTYRELNQYLKGMSRLTHEEGGKIILDEFTQKKIVEFLGTAKDKKIDPLYDLLVDNAENHNYQFEYKFD